MGFSSERKKKKKYRILPALSFEDALFNILRSISFHFANQRFPLLSDSAPLMHVIKNQIPISNSPQNPPLNSRT